MVAASSAKQRVNAVGNFFVDKIDGDVMRAFVVENEIAPEQVDPDGTDEQLAVRLSLFFKQQLEDGNTTELFECEICNGQTPAECDSCPLCGNGGAIVEAPTSAAPDSSPDTAIDAVQMGVSSDPPPSPAPTPETPAAGNVAAAPSKKKNTGATRNEDAPSRAVPPPPADPKKSKKEDPTMTAAAKVTKSKKSGVALAVVRDTVALVGAPDLDKAVLRVEKLKADTQVSFWSLGHELRDINERKLWKLRTDEKGKARYSGWDAFVTHELGLSVGYSYDLIKLAGSYTEEQVQQWGKTKLAMILKAPPEARDALLADVKAGASKREIAEKVGTERKKSGHASTKQQGKAGKASAKKAAAKKSKADDKITIASIEGRQTIKFYAKPASLKGVVMKDLKRAKTIEAQPFARLELANEVVMHIFLKKTENGIEAVIDTRRESPADDAE